MSTLVYIVAFLLFAESPRTQGASKANCANAAAPVSQEVVEFKKEMKARGLAGVVASPSGPAIPGVTVELLDSKERCSKATTTDGNGEFDLRVIKPGRYKLRLSRAGFNTVIAAVRIVPKEKGLLRLELPMSN
jgi:hypothetical protein